jgi:hypothetical protein
MVESIIRIVWLKLKLRCDAEVEKMGPAPLKVVHLRHQLQLLSPLITRHAANKNCELLRRLDSCCIDRL